MLSTRTHAGKSFGESARRTALGPRRCLRARRARWPLASCHERPHSRWICSVAMRRAAMRSKAPPSTRNLSLRQELPPCQMRLRCSLPLVFLQGSSPAGPTSLCPEVLVSRSGSRNLHPAAERQLRTVTNRQQMRVAKSVQPAALCYAQSSRKVRIRSRRHVRGPLTRRVPGQRATGAAVPVRRAGEAMLPPQLRGRHVYTARRSSREVKPAATGATSRPWTWTPSA